MISRSLIVNVDIGLECVTSKFINYVDNVSMHNARSGTIRLAPSSDFLINVKTTGVVQHNTSKYETKNVDWVICETVIDYIIRKIASKEDKTEFRARDGRLHGSVLHLQ